MHREGGGGEMHAHTDKEIVSYTDTDREDRLIAGDGAAESRFFVGRYWTVTGTEWRKKHTNTQPQTVGGEVPPTGWIVSFMA